MAQAQQAAPAFQPPQHFWDHWCVVREQVIALYKRGPGYGYEDIVSHTWQQICQVYFLNYGNPAWKIHREPYRGLPPKRVSDARPDVTTIRVTQGQQQQDPPEYHTRDYLWIECKAATQDNPHGWKDVLRESVGRLAGAHPNREIFLILGVGVKCMWFVWDPLNQRSSQAQLSIRRANNAGAWPVDPRIKALQSTAWVDVTNGEIRSENAMEIECWKMVQVGGQNVLQNINDLNSLEQFLISVRNAVLPGLNPPEFS